MKKTFACLLPLFFAIPLYAQAPETYGVSIVREYPHDSGAYTQGLFFDGDRLYESTGRYGKSSIREVDLESGKVLRNHSLSAQYFGEGSVVLGGKLYMLTWTNHILFTYDPLTFKRISSFSYPIEGWGLTTDGENLIASDGSNVLYFLTPSLQLVKTLSVRVNGKDLKYLNELEWIDGKIWANVYTTDLIAIINPESGVVEAVVDCTGLLPKSLRTPDTDVLNGIAVHDGHIYLTGKNWPRLYEIKLK